MDFVLPKDETIFHPYLYEWNIFQKKITIIELQELFLRFKQTRPTGQNTP